MVTAEAIVWTAADRFASGFHEVRATWYAFAVAGSTLFVESGRATVLGRAARFTASPALAGSAQNRRSDVLSSAGVLTGLIATGLGFAFVDTLAALLVAALILRSAVRLMWRSGDILIDRAPQGVDDRLRKVIGTVPGVISVGGLKVRGSGSRLLGEASIAATRRLSIATAQVPGARVRAVVAAAIPELDLTLVVEASGKEDGLVERVHAAGERRGRLKDLHNVVAEREVDSSLHLSPCTRSSLARSPWPRRRPRRRRWSQT